MTLINKNFYNVLVRINILGNLNHKIDLKIIAENEISCIDAVSKIISKEYGYTTDSITGIEIINGPNTIYEAIEGEFENE